MYLTRTVERRENSHETPNYGKTGVGAGELKQLLFKRGQMHFGKPLWQFGNF